MFVFSQDWTERWFHLGFSPIKLIVFSNLWAVFSTIAEFLFCFSVMNWFIEVCWHHPASKEKGFWMTIRISQMNYLVLLGKDLWLTQNRKSEVALQCPIGAPSTPMPEQRLCLCPSGWSAEPGSSQACPQKACMCRIVHRNGEAFS